MKITEVFIQAEQALTEVVDQITDDQWDLELPDWFQLGSTQRRDELNLRAIINYHAYDDAWVPDVIEGKTATEVGDKYDGDLLGINPKAAWHDITNKAMAAIRELTDEQLATTVHLSYGDFPASEYLEHITSFRAFRSYDIAKLIGVDIEWPSELTEGLWQYLAPNVEQWRVMGVYGPAVQIPDGSSRQNQLLALCGRNPL